jgi:hypothetical protein
MTDEFIMGLTGWRPSNLEKSPYRQRYRSLDSVRHPAYLAHVSRQWVLAVCAIRLNGQTDRVIRTVRITIQTRTVAIPQ